MSACFLVPWDPARGGLGYVLGEAGKEGRKERPSDAAPPLGRLWWGKEMDNNS